MFAALSFALLCLFIEVHCHSDDLHGTRVVIKAWSQDDALAFLEAPGIYNTSVYQRAIEPQEVAPNILPLSLHHEDGRHMTGMLLKRNRHVEHPVHISYGDTEEHSSLLPQNSAVYYDTLSEATLGMRMENGKRHYSGQFVFDGKRYELQPETDGNQVRSTGSEPHTIHMITRAGHDLDAYEHDDDTNTDAEMDGLEDTVRNARKLRGSRATSTDFHVELALIIDYSEYIKWFTLLGSQEKAIEAIKYKFSYIYSKVDRIYKTISPQRGGMTVKIWIKKIRILTNENESPVKKLNPSLTHETWLDPMLFGRIKGTPLLTYTYRDYAPTVGMVVPEDADLVLFYHRFPMVTRSGAAAAGLARTGMVCEPNGVATVQDLGFESIYTFAHEVGHNLGATHDSYFSEPECSSKIGNVMSKIWGTQYTGKFSVCSLRDMKDNMAHTSCLGNTGSDFIPPCVDPLPGKTYDAAWQCSWKHKDKKTNYYKKITDCPASETDCQKGLNCWRIFKDKRGRTIQKCKRGAMVLPADGTKCGSGKVCKGYQCVAE